MHPVAMPGLCLAGWRKRQVAISPELREPGVGRTSDHRGERAPHYIGPGGPYKDFSFIPSDVGRLWKCFHRQVD